MSNAPYSTTPHSDDESLGPIITLMMWGLGASIMLFLLLATGLWRVLLAMSPMLGLLGLALAAIAMQGVRRRRAEMLVHYVRQALALNLPLPPLLRAAGWSERGRMAAALHEIAGRLEAGDRIGRAMAIAAPEIRPRDLALIAAAERAGRPLAGLDRVVELEGRDTEDERTRRVYGWLYPLLLLVVGGWIIVGLIAYVVPRLEMIFVDMDQTLPAVTQWVLSGARWLAMFQWPLGIALFLAVLIVAVRLIALLFFPRWALRRAGRSWLYRVVRHVPVISRVFQVRQLGDAMTVIAAAVRTGTPLPSAVGEAMQVDLLPSLRRRFGRWRGAMERGVEPAAAARDAGLPRLIAGMLATAQRAGGDVSTVSTLDFLARYYAARYDRAVILLHGTFLPAVVLGLALIVGTVVVGMFLPLVMLIEGVT